MCQGLLYAFCYHLDSLLSRNDSEDALSVVQLQNVHISDAVPAPGLRQSPSCMQYDRPCLNCCPAYSITGTA